MMHAASRLHAPLRGGLLALAPVAALLGGVLAFAAGGAPGPGEAGQGQDLVVVVHTLTLTADGSIAVEEESRSEVTAAFKVNPNLWAPSAIPVPVAYNPSGQVPGLGVEQVIQNAIATWNSVPSGFAFVWAGAVTTTSGACDDDFAVDGVNTISFKTLSGLTLGRTCTIFGGGKLKEFDMELDDDATWSVSSPVPAKAYDLPTTILHELGHAAGLGHSCSESGGEPVCTTTLKNSVMYSRIDSGIARRVLTPDDIAAIQAAYPPGPSTPTATPATPIPGLFFRVRAPLLSRD